MRRADAGGDGRVPATIGAVFDPVLRVDPDREALVGGDRRYSYAGLDAEADVAAAALARLGVGAGNRIGVCLPNSTAIVVAFHGAMRLGTVWVGVNRVLAPSEKVVLLNDAQVTVVLCDGETADALGSVRHRLPSVEHIVVAGEGPGDEWSSMVAAARGGRFERPAVDPFAPAAIAYTSGTTGSPNGIVHSQHNLLVPGAAIVASRSYGPDLRKGDCLSLTIVNLLVLSTLLVAQAGGCSIVTEARDAAGLARWIDAEKVTTWNGVPAMLYDLVNAADVEPSQLASLNEVWSGGARCPDALLEAFAARFGCPVHTTYGLTEAPTVVSIEPRGQAHVTGGSGRALPHLSVTVRDPGGRELAPGESGEICVGGSASPPWAGVYRPMLGYWGKPEALSTVVRDGVLHTGDLGTLDTDGNLYVRDRIKLLIVRGGANVYPAEVEQVVEELDGVAACAVLGVPDERLGERVAAVVEAAEGHAPTAQEIVDHCTGRLARYKIPERFAFVSRLPRNAMGKVRRDRLSGELATGHAAGHAAADAAGHAGGHAAGHWDTVFETRALDEVSWFQAVPTTSLRLLERWARRDGALIDVGAGASTLVDRLLAAGWEDVTVLDVSGAALTKVGQRLGDRSGAVTFVNADVRSWQPDRTYDAWHDRAVFHFLVDPADRDRYVSMTARAVAPGGVVVLATFADDGPTRCSGLPTSRYSSADLVRVFGPAFDLEHAEREEHTTPSGVVQPFSWVVLRRR